MSDKEKLNKENKPETNNKITDKNSNQKDIDVLKEDSLMKQTEKTEFNLSKEANILKELKNIDKNKIYKKLESPAQILKLKQETPVPLLPMPKEEKKKVFLKEIKSLISTVIVSVFIAFIIINYILFIGIVPSRSMSPTINVGEKLIVFRIYSTDVLKRGDIVVFNKEIGSGKEFLIKRLIGLPGDKIKIKTNGDVYINDMLYKNEYVIKCNQNIEQNYVVPANSYFFLGDNRANSEDSRYWEDAFIDEDDIVGISKIRIAPFNKISFIK